MFEDVVHAVCENLVNQLQLEHNEHKHTKRAMLQIPPRKLDPQALLSSRRSVAITAMATTQLGQVLGSNAEYILKCFKALKF
jgi:hypothetical protein